MAEVGGHVWVRSIGCVIAPICRPCIDPRNMARRQGGGSYLRANIEVFRTHMRPEVGDILRLFEPVVAWNDGSAEAVPDLTGSWITDAEAVTGGTLVWRQSHRTNVRLREPVDAWIVEWNATHDGVPYLTSSWIADVEAATGHTRGWCSFEGCGNMADVGGCVRLANIQRVVLAPICRACNDPGNMARRQGGNSRLLANTQVFQIKRRQSGAGVSYIEGLRTYMTEGMRNAERRYGERPERPERPGRWCRVCEIDISDMPANYLVCSPCYLL